MTGKTDLHIHTNISDGRFSPQEIVKKATQLGLGTIAICDHDSIDSIPLTHAAAVNYPQLKVIPGVEISTYAPGSEVHILGYFIDFKNLKLENALKDSRNSRIERAREMITRLNKLNISISWQQVRKVAGSSTVGRPHLAQVMLDKGYIKSFKEAFEKYIGLGGPAYIERYKITPSEAVSLIKEANGLPVLAHPLTINQPEKLIASLKAIGLAGVEVHYNGYNQDERKTLALLADQFNLITTGGSDYHGIDDHTETMLGDASVPRECAERLIALAGQPEQQSIKLKSMEDL
ncbi:MAG: PHP domain-containing protein [Dehalococcoidia bacterium]|nr:MAG: PHP domain-containing protein [Dehalococcoidia bacterium]